MRIPLITILLILAVHTGAYAQNPAEVFEQANQLYQQAKFAEAAAAYQAILHNGYASAELYYNLGNALYKSGNIAGAILNYERALKLIPNDDDLRHNLQIANLLITDKIEAAPRLFVWDYWDSIKASFSLNTITWIVYALYVGLLGSIAFIVIARTYRGRKAGMLVTGGAGVVFVVSLVVLLGKISDIDTRDAAIVTADITTLKNSPDAKSSDAFVLHSGVKVQVTDSVNDWMKVRLADGKVGWMEKNAAEVI